MKNSKFLGLICLFVAHVSFADSWSVTSPNGDIELQISSTEQLHYSVKVANTLIIKNAQADIFFDSDSTSLKDAEVVQAERTSYKGVISPYIKQKSKYIDEHYNRLELTFSNDIGLEFRVFDSGLAYRFKTHRTGQVTVLKEVVDINFVGDFLTQIPLEDSFYSHNERSYVPKKLSELSSDSLASLPLLIDTKVANVVFTETGLRNYPGLWFTGSDKYALKGTHPKRVLSSSLKPKSDRNEIIEKRANDIAKLSVKKSHHFPWRVFAVGQSDGDLITNQLSYLLADDLAISDTSWIKPGKVAWDWWNDNNIFGVDFESGINTKTYKYYIDFAAKYGLEYIILDEGWYELGDALKVVPEMNLKEIIDYGKSKNVDVILWVVWETIQDDLDAILAQYSQWGAKGIKVDFMQRDDQGMVDYYWQVADVAARYKLLVNFHGSYKPAGLRRAYPNVITREGVRGLEHNKWADYITSEHNLTLPFIRMLAGPMDYTPGAMVNKQPENFTVSFSRPMAKTTRAHQVALYVVFESPLQMLADSPSQYLKEHETTSFISQIPTVWDETKVISASLGEHILMARRNEKDWFIAALGNSTRKTFEFDLNFIAQGRYQMSIYKDGVNADKYASDYKIDSKIVSSQEKIKVQLAENGGWVAILKAL